MRQGLSVLPWNLLLAAGCIPAGGQVQTHGMTVGKRAFQARFHGLFLRAKTSRATWAISFLLCRSNRISYGVNIRGAGEVPIIRLSKAVEGVTPFPPSFFEVWSVSLSDFMALFC